MSAYRTDPRITQVGDTQFVVQSDRGWLDVYWDRFEWQVSDGRGTCRTQDEAFAAVVGDPR